MRSVNRRLQSVTGLGAQRPETMLPVQEAGSPALEGEQGRKAAEGRILPRSMFLPAYKLMMIMNIA